MKTPSSSARSFPTVDNLLGAFCVLSPLINIILLAIPVYLSRLRHLICWRFLPCRKAFFTVMDVRSGRWLDWIWQSLDNYQLFCSAKNVEIQLHLMTLISHFLSSSTANPQGSVAVNKVEGAADSGNEAAAEASMTKYAATVTGRNSRGDVQDAVWVLNDTVHLNADGEPLTSESSPYVWLGSFYKPNSSHSNTSSGILRDNSLAAHVTLPLQDSALVDLISTLEHCCENNFAAILLVLGAAVICNH